MSKSKKQSVARIAMMLACVLVFLAFVKLGFWQLARADEKIQIKSAVAEKSVQQTKLTDGEITLEARFSRIEEKGVYLSGKTFFLDRQLLNGVPAYAVITPFKSNNSNTVILINRGLVDAADDRGVIPVIDTPASEITIAGRLNYPVGKPAFWRDSFPVEKNSVWQFFDMPKLSANIGHELAPLIVELDKTLDQAGGYVRQWRPYDDQWVNRHKAYALQWFSMAFAFVIMCFFAFRHRD